MILEVDFIITHTEARSFFKDRKGYCNRGIRAFAERYGLDYSKYLKEGILASTLLATNNAMAEKCVVALQQRRQEVGYD